MNAEERGRKEGENKGEGDGEDEEVELRAVRLEGEESEDVSPGLYFALYGDSAHISRLCTLDSMSSAILKYSDDMDGRISVIRDWGRRVYFHE